MTTIPEPTVEPNVEQLEKELADLRSRIRVEAGPLANLRTETSQWEARSVARRLVDPVFLAGMILSPPLIFLVFLIADGKVGR